MWNCLSRAASALAAARLMVVRITAEQQEALAEAARRRLAARIAQAAGTPHLAQRFHGYVHEAIGARVTVESQVAELALLLHEIDASGKRPKLVTERLADDRMEGDLKIWQVNYAWHQERGLVA